MTARPLNYKHLRYFAEVARRGSLATAARALFVTPQTMSSQIQDLEETIGQPLFDRVGRRLVLTATGHTALDYANAIFALGDELRSVLGGAARPRAIALRIGIADSVAKLQTAEILDSLISHHRRELELECHEGGSGAVLGRLATGDFDAALCDAPVPANLARSLQARLLLEAGTSLLAEPKLAARLAPGFPASLDGAPYLAGSAPTALLGQALEAWFARHDVRPHVVGRIDDSALLKCFAQRGLGFAAVPASIERPVARQYGLRLVGRIDEVRHAVYLVRVRSRRPHPLVAELETQRRQAGRHGTGSTHARA